MPTERTSTAFNLPFNQSASYWLAVFPTANDIMLDKALGDQGMHPLAPPHYAFQLRIEGNWEAAWRKIRRTLFDYDHTGTADVALIPADKEPDPQEFAFARKPADALDKIANSLWLGQAMMDDLVVCYMQPVFNKRRQVFGYEAFARVETGGEPIGGGRIIEASKYLSAEYALDRHLHVKAITSFIESDLKGFLFINFVPGFIHRPDKYLEGLTEAARVYGMLAKQIVLDFSRAEATNDFGQLKAVFEYCRSRGYSLSLDDVSSVAVARKIFETIRPDFIKLDMDLVRASSNQSAINTIGELVSIAHSFGSTVLAEGVETESVHEELKKAEVDLFQGYLFSPPVAVSKLDKLAG